MIKINLYGLGFPYEFIYVFVVLFCWCFVLLSYMLKIWEFLCFVSIGFYWYQEHNFFLLVCFQWILVFWVVFEFKCLFIYSIIWGGVFSSPIFLSIAYLFCHHQKGGDCWPKRLHSPFIEFWWWQTKLELFGTNEFV